MFAEDYTYQPSTSSSSNPDTRSTDGGSISGNSNHNSNCNNNDAMNVNFNSSDSSDSSSTTKTWQELKKEGTAYYQNSNYSQALICFQQAFHKLLSQQEEEAKHNYTTATHATHSSTFIDEKRERAVLLSNSVACRLKIGGTEMIMVAVEEAKRCIAIDDKWYKGHLRLASAYIQLGNHSNDVCQSLQNAIRLNPNKGHDEIALKQMLKNELRRDKTCNSNNSRNGDNNTNGTDTNSHTNNNDENTNYYPMPSAPSLDEINNNIHDIDIDNDRENHDSTPISTLTSSLFQHLQNIPIQVHQLYNNTFHNNHNNNTNNTNHNNINHERNNWKPLLQIFCFLLILYIAFGGRFGLSSDIYSDSRPNYGSGNAYDEFYSHNVAGTSSNSKRRSSTMNSGAQYSGGSQNNYHQHSRYNTYDDDSGNDNYYYSRTRGNNNNYQYERYGDRYNSYGGYDSYSYTTRSRNRNDRGRHRLSTSDWDTSIPFIIVVGALTLLNKILGVPLNFRPRGFGGHHMNIGGGGVRFGFGPGGGGGIRLFGLGPGGFGLGGGYYGRVRVPRRGRYRW